mmetsp:Transcript_20333/g.41027  ORF Transcript_20333/g.41027 Transcript_20333/m.41027 type:complete len:272 (+) Transcript_20333:818-1633(+)
MRKMISPMGPSPWKMAMNRILHPRFAQLSESFEKASMRWTPMAMLVKTSASCSVSTNDMNPKVQQACHSHITPHIVSGSSSSYSSSSQSPSSSSSSSSSWSSATCCFASAPMPSAGFGRCRSTMSVAAAAAASFPRSSRGGSPWWWTAACALESPRPICSSGSRSLPSSGSSTAAESSPGFVIMMRTFLLPLPFVFLLFDDALFFFFLVLAFLLSQWTSGFRKPAARLPARRDECPAPSLPPSPRTLVLALVSQPAFFRTSRCRWIHGLRL